MADETKNKTSFVLFTEQSEVINALSDADAGRLMKAVYKYAQTGEVPNFDDFLKLVFIPIRQQIDRNNEKYNSFVEKQRQNGLKGGRPKNPTVNLENPKNPTVFLETQKSLNDNVPVNENVNENVITQKENKEKVVREEEKTILKSNFYATHPHPDLMFDSDVNKVYDIYKKNCPNLIPIGFGFRDLRLRGRIKEFLNVISGDFDYLKQVCIKANDLKVIASHKIDIDMVINNHIGIFNGKYQKTEEPIDFQAMARSVADRMEKENKT